MNNPVLGDLLVVYYITVLPCFDSSHDLLHQEQVGEYETDVYNITNLILIARRRSVVR